MTPVRKSEIRKAASRDKARKLLTSLISGDRDAYDVYRSLYLLWCSHNSAVQELRPLFQIPGVEPDGRLSVTEDFRRQVLAISRSVIPFFEK